MTDLVAAYSRTGGAWQHGPAHVYDRLAEVLVASSPSALEGCRVLDVGAGTGAAGRAARAAGARRVVAVDAAFGMLAHRAARRPPAVVADALALPFADAAFDAAVAAFSLNHLTAPVDGLREMARVTRAGGRLLVASYAADDDHPVKAAVEAALAGRGWRPEPWYSTLRAEATPQLATLDRCAAVAEAVGLDAEIEQVRVAFPDLSPLDLVAWRLGLAQHAPFVAGISAAGRRVLEVEILARLEDPVPELVRSILVMRSIKP